MSSSRHPPPSTPSQHVMRQLKLVIPGAAISYYLRTIQEFRRIAEGGVGGWSRCVHRELMSVVEMYSRAVSLFSPSPGFCDLRVTQDSGTRKPGSWPYDDLSVHICPVDALDQGHRA